MLDLLKDLWRFMRARKNSGCSRSSLSWFCLARCLFLPKAPQWHPLCTRCFKENLTRSPSGMRNGFVGRDSSRQSAESVNRVGLKPDLQGAAWVCRSGFIPTTGDTSPTYEIFKASNLDKLA